MVSRVNYLYLTKWLLTFHTELIYQLQNHGNLLRLTARKGLYRKVSGTNLHITTYGKPKSKQGRDSRTADSATRLDGMRKFEKKQTIAGLETRSGVQFKKPLG